MPALTMQLKKNSDQHRFFKTRLEAMLNLACKTNSRREQMWQQAEETVLAYVPESTADSARRQQREDGTPKYTTIKIPYSYALLMAAHTYWTSVFFARTPVHQFTGRHGEAQQQTQALEALISYQVTAGDMMGPYYIWLYDTGKYGVGILGERWDQDVTYFSTIEEQFDEEGNSLGKTQITKKAEGYSGNRIYNISPFDFFPDPRVSIGRFQEGEFCAVRKKISWNSFIRRAKQGYYTNVEAARMSRAGKSGEEGSSQLQRPDNTEWMDDEQGGHPSMLSIYEIYVELIPSEWRLSKSDYPEKWVFTMLEDRSLIIGAQPLGLAHGQFPISVLETEVEGYGAWNRGIPEIMEPIQNTMDWLINTHFFNVRSSLNNMFVVDPTKVVMKDLDTTQPGGLVRLKPEAYGTDLRSFFHQIQVHDVTQTHMTDLQNMHGIGERIIGINDQILGALSPGGRKTATEVRTSTGFGVNRLKTQAEYMSATGFSSHSRRLVQSSQQFFDATKKLRIVGNLAKEAGGDFIDVSPDDIAGSYDFVPVDGTLPVDRFAQANLWKEILAGMRQYPVVGQRYDLARIFAWVASLAGLKNIDQFEIEMGSPEDLMQQAAQGNLVPMPGTDSRGTGIRPPTAPSNSGAPG